jgi:hypothetical protein
LSANQQNFDAARMVMDEIAYVASILKLGVVVPLESITPAYS